MMLAEDERGRLRNSLPKFAGPANLLVFSGRFTTTQLLILVHTRLLPADL